MAQRVDPLRAGDVLGARDGAESDAVHHDGFESELSNSKVELGDRLAGLHHRDHRDRLHAVAMAREELRVVAVVGAGERAAHALALDPVGAFS